ncbi:hypothetical protein BaRGS_00018492 [Batillaria attramentaria]|uniref:Uncharacterized protein n=1 Tax=Batillaria attramentaria TaxID=370345 RepID=A0ABD0KSU8_9CAEN
MPGTGLKRNTPENQEIGSILPVLASTDDPIASKAATIAWPINRNNIPLTHPASIAKRCQMGLPGKRAAVIWLSPPDSTSAAVQARFKFPPASNLKKKSLGPGLMRSLQTTEQRE